MSTLKVNAIQGVDGVERYLARAWVNFNGTGTVAIRAAGNVSSITDNGTGDYTVNFSNALTDANYAAVVTGQIDQAGGVAYSLPGFFRGATAQQTSSCRIGTASTVPGALDYTTVNALFFR